ncbi:MAG: cytochrome b/b6 domain-containing protein [Planctomycetota bacterium]
MKRVYLYTVYERIWHWIQALVIILLLITGLELHNPGRFPIFGFANAVAVHSVLGFILVANAFLGLFYHLTTGKIREYLPEPRDFVSQAIGQAVYYLRGIFRGDPHPFERRPGHKLNPLQQITYLAILNVLLPLQTITGLLLWARPEWAGALAPIHTLGSWLFGAFILLHVYLTTTGRTTTSNLEAMITGWDEEPA